MKLSKRYQIKAEDDVAKGSVRKIKRVGGKLYAYPKRKKLSLGDMRLNKKGTVGTEPIAKMKKGKLRYGTEVKLGKLGSVFIPRRKNKPFSSVGSKLSSKKKK